MAYQMSSPLWPSKGENFFRNFVINPLKQQGPHCVSTVLAMLVNTSPEKFQESINTQDPVSWSNALKKHGLKLAYCPNDIRKLRFYADELLQLNDLFTLSYYTVKNSVEILHDPDASGWICGSHIVILHKGQIIDPASGKRYIMSDHKCLNFHTKRIFRVVPSDFQRGL